MSTDSGNRKYQALALGTSYALGTFNDNFFKQAGLLEEVVVEGPEGIAGPEGKRLIFPIPAVGTHGTSPKRCVIAPLRSRQAVRRRTS